MTEKAIGLSTEGYGRVLARTIRMKNALEDHLKESILATGAPIRIAPFCETNIVCFAVALEGESLSHSNQKTNHVYQELSPEGKGPFFVSKTTLKWSAYGTYLDAFVRQWNGIVDSDQLILVRMCLMNPFFDSKEMAISFLEELVQCLITHALAATHTLPNQ
jgi:glutamate/tyrosine decarboxylase-like PLP-dependent enzyme